ncbi:hypothetical protein [Paenibacillus physcomitrellae]|uniref:Uncharacterized protein n=1 Tax=Paenibacillus physcomitrellae TaxID=1619311 RepID=A0ABQ1FM57_9BACL|nr:hypothetical protein [Paenibacillus physcomitrellae]GGA20365.1 hypothetical protein GCM10010917_01260 [Paenibacillus physcomitrellae]
MTEKNILAYFKSPEEAEGAARKLQALRVVDYSIDRFSRYGSGTMMEFAQDLELSHQSAGIMAKADPSNSGMSDGGQGGPTGRDILLTAVVDDHVHHQAMKIIEDAGGMI